MIKIISSVSTAVALALSGAQSVNAATIDQTFTESYQCNSVNLRAQTGVTQQQLINSCNEITQTDTAFHDYFNTNANSSLPNDNNDSLDVYIYLSSAQYKANGNDHFGISTDNGGMYLEGTPANAGNQAKFIAHICEDSWVPFSCAYTGQVYNLQHEYIHYLDGRYNVFGPFGTFTYNAGLAEGLADFLANGTDYARTLNGLDDKDIPPFYNIISADYSHPDLYKWGYMAIHYMSANHRSEYDLIIDALRAGNTQNYRSTLKQVANRIGDGFNAYVTSLTSAVVATPTTVPADDTFGACALEQKYVRYVDDASTSNLSVTNNTQVPLRLMWINNVTGDAGTDAISLLTQGQEYNNNFWRENDRFIMMSENRECVGVGVVGQTANFSVESAQVANVVADVLPAANEIGACSLERPYFKTTTATNVTVTNNSNETMEVRWVNYVTGLRSDTVYSTLNVGESYTGTTWKDGDRMIFVDSSNTCKGVVSLMAGNNTYSISGDVQNAAPVANINGAYIGKENALISFTSAGSVDNDGVIDSYNWNFGDGTTSNLANPSHTYSVADTYTVTLTVTDNEGATHTATTTATISKDGVPPVTNVPNMCATENGITSGNLTPGDAACLGDADTIWLGIADISGHDSVTIKTANGSGDLNLYYDNNNWPTGTNNDDGSSINVGNSECIHVTGGSNYWGNLKVSNSNGTASILVEFDTAGCNTGGGDQNIAPTASVNGPYTGNANALVNFNSDGSADSEGPINAYLWNFGDGNTSTIANPSHSYSTAGTYTVTLTVTDSEGATGTASTTATVLSGGDGSVTDACATTGPTSGWVQADQDMCVPAGSWDNAIAYYGINVPSGTNSIVIKTEHGSGNGNLYYSSSNWATQSSYHQKSDTVGNTESITINNPGSGNRYFSIVGQQSGMAVTIEFK
ncbi:collagenase [Pseudoalteromonas sp. C2R02]|uniref:collagenase n=1 Tax=Pseudoalteromonas sp. C2R02 TaxID=2841565 RepID=UPI001C091CF1|nr:collagenase [Pseudoalteromonas sp. C2R02]MBU2972321.1 collagenase [Pseudoalteromonas sp. C2R02]